MRRHLPLKSHLPGLISRPHSHSPGHIRQPRVWVIMLKVTRTWRRRWRLLFCFYISEPGSRRDSSFYATTREVSNPAPPTVKLFALEKLFILNAWEIFRVSSVFSLQSFEAESWKMFLTLFICYFSQCKLQLVAQFVAVSGTEGQKDGDRQPNRPDTCVSV